MFAIALTADNLPKIDQLDLLENSENPFVKLFVDPVRQHCAMYYFIRGYVNSRGVHEPWALLPDFVFEKLFDFDPDKIQHDWDQIVRL